MEFTPITTQEALDAAVSAAIGDRYGDYEDLKTQAGRLPGLESENRQLKTAALRARVAHESGLPYELAQRLTGEKEEDIRRDAEALRKLIRRQNPGSPMFDPEPPAGDGKKTALRAFAKKLTGND